MSRSMLWVFFAAGEAAGEVGSRIGGGTRLAEGGAGEAKVAFDDLRDRVVTAERRDGDGHGQIVEGGAAGWGRSWVMPRVFAFCSDEAMPSPPAPPPEARDCIYAARA